MRTPDSLSTPNPSAGAELVKAKAREEGFDLVGIARAEPLDPEHLDRWIANGWDAGLGYMRASRDARLDPSLVCPNAKSVVVVAVAYFHEDPEYPGQAGRSESVEGSGDSGDSGRPGDPGDLGDPEAPEDGEVYGVVSRYARGRDYHNVMRKPLARLRRYIDGLFPGSRAYVSCDTRPVMEKAWAQRAGIGWIGKNGLVIAPPYGSWVLLGTIITTAELSADAPYPDRCGSCVACLSACPTDAIVEPRFVDASRCISFHTIEHRKAFPPEIAAGLGDRILGCDACQEVCPWNRRPKRAPFGKLHPQFAPRENHAFVPLRQLLQRDEAELKPTFAGTPLARPATAGLKRSARVILDLPAEEELWTLEDQLARGQSDEGEE